MEPLDKLTVKLKSHVWCIILFSALMIFWIIAFSFSGKGDNTASWQSILFAVVVIVYMLIQGHEMRNLVEEGHRLMAEKFGAVEESAKKFEAIAKLLESTEQPTTVSVPPSEHKYELNASISTCIILYMFYAVSRSYVLKKSVSLRNLVKNMYPDNEKTSDAMYWIGQGILRSLESFLEKGSLEIGMEQQKAKNCQLIL